MSREWEEFQALAELDDHNWSLDSDLTTIWEKFLFSSSAVQCNDFTFFCDAVTSPQP